MIIFLKGVKERLIRLLLMCCVMFFLLGIVAGCSTTATSIDVAEEKMGMQLEDDVVLYAQTLSNYQQIVKERLSQTFEEDYNSDVQLLSKTSPNENLKYKWHCMIVDMISGFANPSASSFGYTFMDMNQDGVKEMLWIREDGVVLAIYTLVDGNAVLVDAFWPRYKGIVTNNGLLYTRSSSGAEYIDFTIRTLMSDGQWDEYVSFGIDGHTDDNQPYYYEMVEATQTEIDKTRFEELREQWPFKQDEQPIDIIKITDDLSAAPVKTYYSMEHLCETVI